MESLYELSPFLFGLGAVSGVSLFFYLWGLFQIIVMIILAFAVKNDAEHRCHAQKGLFLVSPLMWAFVVLVSGGYVGAFGYWIIHYSVLKARPPEHKS